VLRHGPQEVLGAWSHEELSVNICPTDASG
jgi:hypothetical protein